MRRQGYEIYQQTGSIQSTSHQRKDMQLRSLEKFSTQELCDQVWLIKDHSGHPREDGLPGEK